MFVNILKPAEGSRKDRKRVGRGIGSTLGKTCGKGHKGQKARAGGFHKIGFEGGQMPLQRRLPKVGFRSMKKPFIGQVRLDQLTKISDGVVNFDVLRALGLIERRVKKVRIIDAGSLHRSISVIGIPVSAGARRKIEALGGTVEV